MEKCPLAELLLLWVYLDNLDVELISTKRLLSDSSTCGIVFTQDAAYAIPKSSKVKLQSILAQNNCIAKITAMQKSLQCKNRFNAKIYVMQK